jgi:hypothetical protein
LDEECYIYNITVGKSGTLNLTGLILSLPCSNLCSLLSADLLTLNIPLNITGTVLNLPLVAQGYIGLDVATGACGIIITVDLLPLYVNALNIINLNICLDLSLVLNLGGLLNGLLGGIFGTTEVLLSGVTALTSGTLVPNLCVLTNGITSGLL